MITEINHKIMPGGKRYSEFITSSDEDLLSMDTTNLAHGSKATVITDYPSPISGGEPITLKAEEYYDEDSEAWKIATEGMMPYYLIYYLSQILDELKKS